MKYILHELKDLTPFDIEPEVYNNYKIKVKVDYIEDKKVRITVKDRGIGINWKSLIDMANVGQSWNKRDNFKKELKDVPSWLKPTGGFGIGIQSCFMVTDEINIRTKTYDNNDGIKINIESGKEEGYITSEIDKNVNFNRGSEVIVDVPQNLERNYNIWGYANEKIKNYDPFADENEIFLWIITEYIEKEFKNPLFEIELVYENKIEKSYKSIIQSYNMFYEKNCKSTNNYLFIFDNKNLNKSYLWDKQNSTSIEMKLLPISDYAYDYGYGLSEYYFKGVKTECYCDGNIIDPCNVYFNINGMDASEILTLNREKIKQEATNVISNMRNNAIKFILKEYKQKIEQDENFIVKNNIYTFNLKVLYDICNINDNINKKLIENCNEKVNVLEKNSSGILSKNSVKISEVVRDNKVALFNMRSVYIDEKTISYMESIIKSKNLGYKFILIDDRLISIIRRYYNNCIKEETKNNLNEENSIKVCIYELNIKKADSESKKDLLKKLANNSEKRMVIGVIEGYENLEVKELPCEFVEKRFFNSSDSNYILSPITREDNKEIKKGIPKDLIKDKIRDRNDFKKLVDYVFKNRTDGNKASKEDIINDYMKLIGEYYDLIKEGSKESESK
jgi:hypothetical protein